MLDIDVHIALVDMLTERCSRSRICHCEEVLAQYMEALCKA